MAGVEIKTIDSGGAEDRRAVRRHRSQSGPEGRVGVDTDLIVQLVGIDICTRDPRTSTENLFVVLLISAPPSQELEPLANPVRFSLVRHGRHRVGL